MKLVDAMMQKAVSENVFPGGVLLVSKNGTIRFYEAYGYANVFTQLPMTKSTLFDLASLTKPLATTLAVMRLIQRRKIALEKTVGDILPQLKHGSKEHIQIGHLLGHCSGLPDYRPYYLELCHLKPPLRKSALRDFVGREPLVNPVGKEVLYSDLGFMLLAWIIETTAGNSLNRVVEEEIYLPLGLKDLFFVDLHAGKNNQQFAATEKCPWRGRVMEGAVHDENAFVVGGVAGHAGLFGKAMDICRLLEGIMYTYQERNADSIFTPNLVKRFLTCQGSKSRTLGFDTPSTQDSSSGEYFSKNSVGHLGFTGTSFWMDLERSIIVILLTNRVHPTRTNEKIKAFRPQLHNAVMRCLVDEEKK